VMRTHKDLDIWKEGIELVKLVYKLTADFPDSEKFGLVSQMRRCVISIPSNLAEGAARSGKKEFMQFCYIALGSLSELETQIIISKELEFINSENYLKLSEQVDTIRKKLLNFIKYLKGKTNEK